MILILNLNPLTRFLLLAYINLYFIIKSQTEKTKLMAQYWPNETSPPIISRLMQESSHLTYFISYYYFEMTLNLRKEGFQKTNVGQMKSEFMQQHKITVNQPKQTHFSVEGVQTYSPQEIAALKAREDRVKASAQKEGEFVKTQAYKIDDEIDFVDRPSTANQEMRTTLKPKKNKKAQPEEAKPQAKVKPSIKNELSRANQKITKRNKEVQKKSQYEQRLDELKQQYKKHFGDTLKSKSSRMEKKKESVHDEQIENNEEESFQMQEEEGDQCLPELNKEREKSFKTMAKTGKEHDDSFQEVEWQEKPMSIRSSKLNASTYSQKLGNAVHLLFD